MAALLRPAAVTSFALLITAYRLYVLHTNGHNLYADEAQYWEWSRHFAFGYYSKPPVIAWLIALTTGFCGESEFCIRLGSPLLHLLISGVIFLIARELTNRVIASWAMIVYLTLPAVSFSSLLISTDPPLLLFWSLSLLCFVKAVKSNQLVWWLLAGVAAGFGMLSKYTMILFLPSAMLYLFLTKEYRHLLYSKGFWLAAAVALLVYAPNIGWNAQHGFVSYLHIRDISNLQKQLFHPGKQAAFIGMQALVFGPVLCGMVFVGLCTARKYYAENNTRLLLCFILPLLLLITALSFLSKAEANWAVPVYSAATIWVVILAFRWSKPWLIYGTVLLHLLCMGMLYHYTALTPYIPFPPVMQKSDARLKGWRELGEAVQQRASRYPGALLLFDERKTLAEMLYYTKDAEESARKWNKNRIIEDHYDLTRDANREKGRNFLAISKFNAIEDMRKHFQRIHKLDDIIIFLYPSPSLHYRVYYLEGFKGY